jgi:AraC-like DNA-binding protein
MSATFLSSHCRLMTSDLDEAREYVGRMWEPHQSALKRGRDYGIRWHQADLSHVSLSYVDNLAPLQVRCSPVNAQYRLTLPESGSVLHSINGREAEATPSQAVFYAFGSEMSLDLEPFRSLLLSFQGPFVERALKRRFGHVPTVAQWPSAISFEHRSALSLRSLVRWLGQELDRPTSALFVSSHPMASLERALLSLFVDGLNAQHDIDPRTPQDLSTRQIARIEAWLDAHFAEPIGVEDLAHAEGVSVRSLQAVFRRLRGYPPGEAIVRRRLQHARKLLTEAAPGATVTQIAIDSGFFHLSRFAARYVQRFGERPSHTLARARRNRA